MNKTAVPSTAATRYAQLTQDRQHFIDRADKAAKLTIPTIFQKDVASAASLKIKDPEQSMGARGVNTLASKMVMSLMPTNTPFFKLTVDLINPNEPVDAKMKTEILQGLGIIEKQTIRDVEASGDVTVAFEMLKLLITTGNCLMFVGEKGTRLYNLNKYGVLRDPSGEWTELVVCEEVAPAALSQAVLSQIQTQEGAVLDPKKNLTMYTHVTREKGRVKWYQEINGVTLEGSVGNVPEAGSPWLPLRFIRVDGENYGRGYIEMYMGDLKSLEVLTKAVNEASTAAAKVIFLVRPNGSTNPKVVSSAPNLSVRSGDANDVSVLRLDKAADLNVAKEMIGTIERRLAFAFMINAEVMRDAERVTAEEIRLVAQELDSSLGGIYSLLSKEFQVPYVNRRLHMLVKQRKVKPLPKSVKPSIVTGFAALGRGHDGDKLMRFIEKVNMLLNNPSLAQLVNIQELITRLAVADGIDLDGLLISQEEQAEAADAAQQNQMMEKLGPEVIRQAGPMLQNAMQGEMDGTSPA